MNPETTHPLTVRAVAARVLDGVRHMPGFALFQRLFTLAFGLASTLWLLVNAGVAAAVLLLVATSLCSTITALELCAASFEHDQQQEPSDPDDLDDSDDAEFGQVA